MAREVWVVWMGGRFRRWTSPSRMAGRNRRHIQVEGLVQASALECVGPGQRLHQVKMLDLQAGHLYSRGRRRRLGCGRAMCSMRTYVLNRVNNNTNRRSFSLA